MHIVREHCRISREQCGNSRVQFLGSLLGDLTQRQPTFVDIFMGLRERA